MGVCERENVFANEILVCASLKVSCFCGRDEELLGQGLELNDRIQTLLAKHDAIASGSPMPAEVDNLGPKSTEEYSSNIQPTQVKDASPSSSTNANVSVANVPRSPIDEEDEEEDDFAQLARRYY